MLDFAALPPEINSALMYAGPGSGSMTSAAAAWTALSAELQAVASSYDTLVQSLLDGPWQGPSAAAMAAAAASQISWLRHASALADESGAQAAAAANAYEAAFAATVPPPEIEANRALLMTLLATNVIGQNTAAIAATEAQYGEMWAQDAGAMYSYAAATAAASTLSPFNPVTPTTNPAGLANQAAAVAQAVGSGAATSGADLNAIPAALQGLAGLTNTPPALTNPAAALGLTGIAWNTEGDGLVVGGALGDALQGLTGSATIDASTAMDAYIRLANPTRLTVTVMRDVMTLSHDLPKWAGEGAQAAAKAATSLPAAIPSALPSLPTQGLGGISGAVGQAASVGGLKVPASWTATAPAAAPVNVALNGAGAAAGEHAASAFGGVPLAPGSAGGRGVANFAAPRYGFKPTVIAQPPAGG